MIFHIPNSKVMYIKYYWLRYFVILLLIFLEGCSARGEPKAQANESYLVRGRNYTFAAYNAHHRLITHPVEDMLAEMKGRLLAHQPPITDVYVVSHGWNFTMPVAIANYHNYMHMVDEILSSQRNSNNEDCKTNKDSEDCYEKKCLDDSKQSKNDYHCFQPYFIFITWVSTVRPTTDLVNAVMPFGLDAALRPLTSLIDKVPAHLITAWKESLNAEINALGWFPNHYLDKDWNHEAYGHTDNTFIEDSDESMGQDLPVSAMVYKLIQLKTHVQSDDEIDKGHKPFNPQNSSSDAFISWGERKIHLVGHSYGAKLIAQAGMEGIRRWMLSEAAKPKHFKDLYSDYKRRRKCDFDFPFICYTEEHEKQLNELEGELKLLYRVTDTPNKIDQFITNKIQSDATSESTVFPIESLLLFNPAFTPDELDYPIVGSDMKANPHILSLIPRKAIVYSNSDYANGALFSAKNILLNGSKAQDFNTLNNAYFGDFFNVSQITLQDDLFSKFTNAYNKQIFYTEAGAFTLPLASVFSILNYGYHSVKDTLYDFKYHLTSNPLLSCFDLQVHCTPAIVFNGVVNPVDFFLPIKLTHIYSKNEQQQWDWNWPAPWWQLPETEQGIFRLSSPGLGSTGLNHLAEGRDPDTKLAGLVSFYNEKCAPNQQQCAENISPDTFCTLSEENKFFQDGPDFDFPQRNNLRKKFFSFDASLVFDGPTLLIPGYGSHGDLRADDKPKGCRSSSNSTKRKRTLNFILNFTKTKFDDQF